MTFGYVLNHMHNFQATEKSCLMAIHLGGTTAPGPLPWLIVKCILVALLLLLTIPVACICCFQFYTVVACKSGEDDDSGIWQTTESWLDVDNNNVLWACYPFKNRQSCTVNYVEKHHPLGGRKWDKYEVTSLYFHTVSYEKLCREIGEWPPTDDDSRAKLLRNAALAFSVRHALEERNASQVNYICIITLVIVS